jgi:hypothetical protein
MATTTASFAQEKSIETLKQELETAKVAKVASDAKVAEINDAIAKLTPLKVWTNGGYITLNLGQTYLSNWVAGGNSNFSGVLIGHYHKNYKKGKENWNNSLDAKWGMIKNHDFSTGKGDPLRKNEDYLRLISDFSHDVSASGKLQAGFMADFQSQFTPTYDQVDTNKILSQALSPAYLKVVPYIGYKFSKYFKIRFSPATGKMTFVTSDTIAKRGEYIPLEADGTVKKFRAELGAYATANFEKEIVKNIKYRSGLDLFMNYMNNSVDDFGKSKRTNIDVNWSNDIMIKATKYIGITISTMLIYDEDQRITLPNGSKAPRTQFRENFGLGLTYDL